MPCFLIPFLIPAGETAQPVYGEQKVKTVQTNARPGRSSKYSVSNQWEALHGTVQGKGFWERVSSKLKANRWDRDEFLLAEDQSVNGRIDHEPKRGVS